jgi:hypothetical protein
MGEKIKVFQIKYLCGHVAPIRVMGGKKDATKKAAMIKCKDCREIDSANVKAEKTYQRIEKLHNKNLQKIHESAKIKRSNLKVFKRKYVRKGE